MLTFRRTSETLMCSLSRSSTRNTIRFSGGFVSCVIVAVLLCSTCLVCPLVGNFASGFMGEWEHFGISYMSREFDSNKANWPTFVEPSVARADEKVQARMP